VRLTRDPLRLNGTKGKRDTEKAKGTIGAWLQRAPVGSTLDDARRQF